MIDQSNYITFQQQEFSQHQMTLSKDDKKMLKSLMSADSDIDIQLSKIKEDEQIALDQLTKDIKKLKSDLRSQQNQSQIIKKLENQNQLLFSKNMEYLDQIEMLQKLIDKQKNGDQIQSMENSRTEIIAIKQLVNEFRIKESCLRQQMHQQNCENQILQDKIKELKDEEKLYKSSSYYSQKIELDKLSREKDQKIQSLESILKEKVSNLQDVDQLITNISQSQIIPYENLKQVKEIHNINNNNNLSSKENCDLCEKKLQSIQRKTQLDIKKLQDENEKMMMKFSQESMKKTVYKMIIVTLSDQIIQVQNMLQSNEPLVLENIKDFLSHYKELQQFHEDIKNDAFESDMKSSFKKHKEMVTDEMINSVQLMKKQNNDKKLIKMTQSIEMKDKENYLDEHQLTPNKQKLLSSPLSENNSNLKTFFDKKQRQEQVIKKYSRAQNLTPEQNQNQKVSDILSQNFSQELMLENELMKQKLQTMIMQNYQLQQQNKAVIQNASKRLSKSKPKFKI